MKKLAFLSSLFLLAMNSCTNEEVINQEFPNKYEKRISVVAEDLTPAEGTRTSYTDNGNGYSFAWSEGDALGIFPTSGHQTDFPIGEGVGSNTAVFDGGKWALRPNESYAAYYPLIHDFDLDPTAILVNYTGQVQNGNGSTAHLGKYDYMASTFTEVDAKGNVNFHLQHLGCLVQFKLTMPDADTYTELEITSDKTPFITSAKYSLSDNAHAFYDVQTSQTVTIGLSNVSTTAEDKTLIITAMFAPVDLSDSKLTLTVIGNNGNYTFEIDGQKLSQGNSVNSNSTAESGLDANGNIIFADAIFKAYMVKNFDKDGNGEISVAEAEAVKYIYCYGEWDNENQCYLGTIKSLVGIEYCKNLTILACYGNQLTSLDVSQNTSLVRLYCYSNQISSLDLSNNTALTEFACGNDLLTTLDLSNNTALTYLHCSHSQLTSLDLSNNTALTELNCCNNQLTTLDISNNTALTALYCGGNQLTSLDASNNTALTYLACDQNQLTSLDVRNNPALTSLFCNNNQLTTLDVSNSKSLTQLVSDNNKLIALDVSNNTELTYLSCLKNPNLTTIFISEGQTINSLYKDKNAQLVVKDNNAAQFVQFEDTEFEAYMLENFDDNKDGKLSVAEAENVKEIVCAVPLDLETGSYNGTITSLKGIEYCKNLTALYCYGNKLASLDVSNNPELTTLYCSGNQLTSLDVSKNTKLIELSCQDNQLTSIDLSNNPKLTRLWCSSLNLTTLNVSKNTKLMELSCQFNLLTELDVRYNTALTTLMCQGNQLTTLDVSNNTELTELYCFGNDLTELNVSNNTVLTMLMCQENQLTTLDLSNNLALTILQCTDNQLTSLDVSQNTQLTELWGNNNNLETIDVSNNSALTMLAFHGNPNLTTIYISEGQTFEYLGRDSNTELVVKP